MRKGEILTLKNAKVGLKVKIAIGRNWAEVPTQKPYAKGKYCWVKGRIKSINTNGSFIICATRYKWNKRNISSFSKNLCIIASLDNTFKNIYLQLK